MTTVDPLPLSYASPAIASMPPIPRLPLGDPRPLSRFTIGMWAAIVTVVYVLLWSPWWYPLSDSSLYLSLARAMATGRGFTFMGDPHRLVPPLGPLIFSLVMRCGGGIGAIQAVCIGMMLMAHALCFLTLRRWVTPRLALTATLTTALSYWVFYNAFAIMSEPPCLVFFWGGMFVLSGVQTGATHKGRWCRVIIACLLLLGAVETRVAAVFLVPGAVIALLINTARIEKRSTQLQWGLLFVFVFGLALAWYRYPNLVRHYLGLLPATAPTTQQAVQPGINSEYGLDDNGAAVREGRYKSIWLYGVKRDVRHMVTDVPALAGQWVTEGLAMPLVMAFRTRGVTRELVRLAAIALFALCLIGFFIVARRRLWWILGLLPYFLVFWLQWGTRIKPRYMAPIAPLLFILLWAGISAVVARIRGEKSIDGNPRTGRLVAGFILLGVILGNAPAWGMEYYLRHGTSAQFYDVARQGALAELVDIGAYLQHHMADNETVWVNVGANRRIIYFLTGRAVDVPIVVGKGRIPEVMIPNWSEIPTGPDGKAAQTLLDIYFRRLPASARYAIAYAEPHPWPDWHWPLRPGPKLDGEEWWRLYERGPHGRFHRVIVPPSRDTFRPFRIQGYDIVP